jgi:hypothetical protein
MIKIVLSQNWKLYNKKEIVSIIENKSDNFSFLYNYVSNAGIILLKWPYA